MKQFIFNENEDVDLNKLVNEMFLNINANDPASIYYKRHLERPKINWMIILLHIFFAIIFVIVTIKIFLYFEASPITAFTVSFIILFLYLLMSLKKILICFVHIYQHFAPDSIRMKCRFEPSCSQYMIMALEKHGVVKGLLLGLRRLCRCRVGNGGYDYP